MRTEALAQPERKHRITLTALESPELAEFQRPGRSHGLVDVLRKRYLLRLLVRKGTATRYRNSALGWVWSYIKPLSQYVIYYFIMGVILGNTRNIENFPVYLLSGVIAINFFNEAFSNATKSITDNKALVKKIYLPRELFPVASVIVAFIHFLPQVVVLIAVALLSGWLPSLATLGCFVLGVVLLTILATGLGLILGAVNVAYRDAQNLVEIIRMFATWTAPVLYSWQHVAAHLPGWAAELYMLNPLTSAVELFHRAFWYTGASENMAMPPELWRNVFISLGFSAVILVIGQFVFRKLERGFAQDL
jgi:ABC-2 type transport system permease protein